ncbi:AzlC family ABC transporter permease [Dermatophilus congolensis]|uniref:AzlC family ABC transporter permease n=1 Tax=Dermatophilus congolensis TaxID=1863 RepID=UPI001AAF7CA8|nr:AzlC family ABC transporter permease [Dermatophilus congolensis]MBO3143619.1 AzlC family ABC transporter permease [Dermatophilus congolensis]MBO3152612.1 AzlC family ABC transporter permease [Dermatophilus congolensis]MBO3160377.1 AzlC family ABC transporter permease [Dermatophilus congolensis]MBO3163896.1 AzlC family ABC transporter permease [Dermatophilus congolensis]MBO3177443.1 AzlC family ABC transporter permease [Dermatophilus congolensis]
MTQAHPPHANTATAAIRDSIPIGLGYFTVSLALGVYADQVGMDTVLSGFMSAFTLSSSGEFAGLNTLETNGTYLQLAIGVILVNLRYVLMAISLGQRLGPEVKIRHRILMAWGITDEIYALGMARRHVGFVDYVASMVLPILGWTSGTIVGSLVGASLPPLLTSAAGVLLYAMFVAIVIPTTHGSRPMLAVVLGASALSVALSYLPGLDAGWRTIIVTIVVSAIAATFAPCPDHPDEPDLPTDPGSIKEIHA